jgi:hypothetical protein
MRKQKFKHIKAPRKQINKKHKMMDKDWQTNLHSWNDGQAKCDTTTCKAAHSMRLRLPTNQKKKQASFPAHTALPRKSTTDIQT